MVTDLNPDHLLLDQADDGRVRKLTSMILDHVEQRHIRFLESRVNSVFKSTTESFQAKCDLPKSPDKIGLDLELRVLADSGRGAFLGRLLLQISQSSGESVGED